ncbi:MULTISPECIES: hypothetical protein [Citrobacter]|nr:hypothetical protein [Citrobacter braakii]
MRYRPPIFITALAVLLTPVAWTDVMPILPCESSDITVHTDDRSGLHDGM